MPYGTSYTRFQYSNGRGGSPLRPVEKLKDGIVVETFPSVLTASKSVGKNYGAYMKYLIEDKIVHDGHTYRYKYPK